MKLFYDETDNTTGIPIDECPYCGCKAVLLINGGYWKPTYCVSCTNSDVPLGPWRCRGVKHPDQFDPEDPVVAIQMWNKRLWPLPPSPLAVLRDCAGNWYDVTGKLVEEYREGQP